MESAWELLTNETVFERKTRMKISGILLTFQVVGM